MTESGWIRYSGCKEMECFWNPESKVCEDASCQYYNRSASPSHARWNQLLANSVRRIKELATKKGGEYAGDDDRLANFRRNGKALGLPMEIIWAVYAAKHWDAITQFIKDKKDEKKRERMEPIEGRIDDLLVYLLLLKMMITEESPMPLAKQLDD